MTLEKSSQLALKQQEDQNKKAEQKISELEDLYDDFQLMLLNLNKQLTKVNRQTSSRRFTCFKTPSTLH